MCPNLGHISKPCQVIRATPGSVETGVLGGTSPLTSGIFAVKIPYLLGRQLCWLPHRGCASVLMGPCLFPGCRLEVKRWFQDGLEGLLTHRNTQGAAVINRKEVFFDIGGAVFSVQLTTGRDRNAAMVFLQNAAYFFEYTKPLL